MQQEEAGFDAPQMAEKRAAYLRDEARIEGQTGGPEVAGRARNR